MSITRPAVISFATVTLLLTTAHVSAQDAPTRGLLYNTQENHSLTYFCEPVKSGQLDCEFVQTGVRFKVNASDIKSSLESARKQFSTYTPESADECTSYREALAVLEGKKPTPKLESLRSLSGIEKRDAGRMLKVMIEYCDRPSETTYMPLIKLGLEKDQRTCIVGSKSFKQSFRLVSEGNAKAVWVVAQSSPEGTCGIVQLSRFEPEETSIGKRWSYIARKAITNPSETLFPGVKCGELDERLYTYNWRPKEHQMSCDYIQFSPL